MKESKKNIGKHFIELLIVAFGVFLGMYVSEWKSNQRIQQNTAKSLNYLIEELESNQKNLAQTIEYHDTIKINLAKITQTLDKKEFDQPYFKSEGFQVMKIEKWTGIGLPQYETISYEGAKINGVFQELDFEIVQLIASAYKQILLNQELGKSTLDKLLQTNSSSKVADVIGTIELLTSDILNHEYHVAKELKSIVEKLKEYKTRRKM